MSIYIDKKFLNQISPMLGKFKWKKENLANCRCPICGDSQKNPNKCRGFFFEKGSDYFFKCHNCGASHTLYKFLEIVAPAVCKEYQMERYRSGQNGKSNYKKVDEKELFTRFKKPEFKKPTQLIGDLVAVKDLPDNHFCREFVEFRHIPKKFWSILYFTADFGKFCREFDPTVTAPTGAEPRLIIPIFNKEGDMVGAQGRSLNFKDEYNARTTAKYITVKADKSIEKLWYGMWRADPKKTVYVVEGPIDSLFIPNTIAMVGAGAMDNIHDRFKDSDMVFALDNEPRNVQIIKYMEKLIAMGRTVCFWPDSLKSYKDINDMIADMSASKIKKIIDKNSYSGLEAQLALKAWRKV